MRIVYLGTSRPLLSGGILSTLLAVDGLREIGHDAEVIATEPAPEWSPVDVPWTVAEDPAAEAGGADAIVTGFQGVDAALGAGAGVVAQVCSGYEKLLWPAAAEEIERIYRLPTLKLVISEHLRELLAADLGVDSTWVGIACLLDRFAAAPAPEPRGEGPLRVLSVGEDPDGPWAPVPFKGIERIHEISGLARARGSDVQLVRAVPGAGGPARGEAEIHSGVRPEAMPDLYRSCHVYLSASTEAEGMGLPAFEAAMAGIPGVLPRIPSYLGVPELEQAALFYPAGDVEAAAEQLGRLASDEDLRARLGAAGRALDLRERFAPTAVAARIADALAAAK